MDTDRRIDTLLIPKEIVCIPIECNGVQNEEHVLVCPLTQETWAKYDHDSDQLSSIFVDTDRRVLVMLHVCLAVLEHQQD